MDKIGSTLALGFFGLLLATGVLGLVMACIEVWVMAYDTVIGWVQ